MGTISVDVGVLSGFGTDSPSLNYCLGEFRVASD